ncbi:procollagen-lysine 5-dioxygenase [Aureococcus anophagefferens]|nr:procollagen-lysine 5-dioxygenase [Aureococcus anophagefferens]
MANLGQHEFYEYWILEVGPIWVRSEPCHEKGERVGHEKQGTYVASARRVGNWVELVGRYRDADNRPCGGWMMVDGRDKGLGLLLRRLDGAEAVAAKLQQVKRDALADALSPANQERYDVRAEIEAARAGGDSDSDDDADELRAGLGGFAPNAWARRPILFGGLHRSGTTTFTSLLNESPLVAGFRDTDAPEDEGQHLQDVVPTDESFGGVGRFALEESFHWTEDTARPEPRASAPKLLEAWDAHWTSGLPAKKRRARVPVLLEKSPANLVHLRWLRAAFGARARFVVMARHPLAVAFATRKFMQQRAARAMELFTADDELLGRPTRVVRLDEFRDDPHAAVAAVEAACLGGASLRVPLAAYEKVSKRDADEVYRAQWRDWPWEDHEARIPGRVAENVRDRPRDDDDEGCADDDDAPPAPAPATVEAPGVVSFPALTDDFCDALVREVDHYRRSGLPSRNPNSMNQYGLILNDVGMRGTFSAFLKYVLLPVGARLFGDDRDRSRAVGGEAHAGEDWGGSSLDDHHTFVVQYAKGRDIHLDMHIDECDVTFNFGLTDAARFAGNDLTFCGMYYAETHRRRSATYKHARGRCVVHSGKRRHGALDIEDGERASLIMWTKSSAFHATAEYARRNVRALNHSGGADRVCLSYSHDPDYKRLMPKGLQYSMVDDGPLATAAPPPPTRKAWRTVCDEAKLKNDQSRRLVLEAENEQVVVFRHRRKLFAIDNRRRRSP